LARLISGKKDVRNLTGAYSVSPDTVTTRHI